MPIRNPSRGNQENSRAATAIRRSSLEGFSLIELLIVVAIILVIAAMAVPSFMRSRISANEASATISIRTIVTAEHGYAMTYPHIGFADQLTKLADPPPGTPLSQNAAGFLDWVLGCSSQPCPKSGYNFAIANISGSPVVSNYSATAVPIQFDQTGRRGFCSDQAAYITYDPAGGTSCTIPLQ